MNKAAVRHLILTSIWDDWYQLWELLYDVKQIIPNATPEQRKRGIPTRSEWVAGGVSTEALARTLELSRGMLLHMYDKGFVEFSWDRPEAEQPTRIPCVGDDVSLELKRDANWFVPESGSGPILRVGVTDAGRNFYLSGASARAAGIEPGKAA